MGTKSRLENNSHKKRQHDSVNFGIWMLTLFVGHSLGAAIAVGLAGLILDLEPRKLLPPYALLVYCGFVFAPLLYWARIARSQPKSCARRFAIAMFLYLQVLALAIGLGAIKTGLLGPGASLGDYFPFTLPFSAIACFGLYFGVRQMLEAHK